MKSTNVYLFESRRKLWIVSSLRLTRPTNRKSRTFAKFYQLGIYFKQWLVKDVLSYTSYYILLIIQRLHYKKECSHFMIHGMCHVVVVLHELTMQHQRRRELRRRHLTLNSQQDWERKLVNRESIWNSFGFFAMSGDIHKSNHETWNLSMEIKIALTRNPESWVKTYGNSSRRMVLICETRLKGF